MRDCYALVLLLLHINFTTAIDYDFDAYPTKSGVGIWVDVDTPAAARSKVTSRGETWELVMSDEFELDGRSFKAGKDHLWTALDIPDGVNGALEYYNSSNVYTKGGKLINKIEDGPVNVTYFNQWLDHPTFQSTTLHYSSGMLQSWNKFCFQGGFVEVAAKLPGATNKGVDPEHPNPTLNPNAVGVSVTANGQTTRLTPADRIVDKDYYPTWPGIWLMGNLGRALFSASTNRMWPWTYNECNPDLAPHQIISACNSNPGFGLNPNQGRGAPEIDILEGGGAGISSSIQIAPGMPDEYRRIPVNGTIDNLYCYYWVGCATPGANIPDAPSAAYASRNHRSWYQGLRYAANNRCPPLPSTQQQYEWVLATRTNQSRLTSNTKDLTQMSAAWDVNADLGLIDNAGTYHWGINYNGTCFPEANAYIGSYLCDPDNKNPKCPSPRKPGVADTHQMDKFNYQMDAISVNWAISYDAYTTFYIYQVEWVMGAQGYIRWTLAGAPLFEIPSSALTNPPQGLNNDNPKKIMIEEPLYVIFNVALANQWGVTPPNRLVGPCRGNATSNDPVGSAGYNKTMSICDSFPMYMEIDYVRIYQAESTMMAIGCDPPTHPTKQWIDGHLKWYTDAKNPLVRVDGLASCNNDMDCQASSTMEPTGFCVTRRCHCATNYGGPRCTKFVGSKSVNIESDTYFGPRLIYPAIVVCVVVVLVVGSTVARLRRRQTAIAAITVVRTPKVDGNYIEASDDDDDDNAAAFPRRYYAPVTGTAVTSTQA
ncbi:Aste57867_10505 [Aphanomyces stellatus]|uniref:Aste57867_10505 protein n=1 Tax=Aphanomyces stellatus TaxID=120398 RepID=A0A485KQJ8_9STRA|nr:hypothetical protein As57867_010465 [Aphanomyces stellatus]VFT87378.1 Aste57867_10505 [Aphanomyces stellatus]